ncbi:MAG: GyrI-like domain-containing protein [Rhizomicrobium sp.]
MDVAIKHLEAMRIAYVPHVGPYDEVWQAWGVLYKAFFVRILFSGRNPRCFGIAYDDPAVTNPAQIRYDACVKISSNSRPGKGISARMLEGGDYATMIHKGPYNEVGKVYAALYGQWLPHSGYEKRDGPTLEFYLNNPRKTSPEDLLTEVYAPVRKADVAG